MAQKDKGDSILEIPPFGQDDEWWSRAVVLEPITELESAFIYIKLSKISGAREFKIQHLTI